MQTSQRTLNDASHKHLNRKKLMFNEINSSVNLDSEDGESGVDISRNQLVFSDSVPRVFVSDSSETLFSRNGFKFGNT